MTQERPFPRDGVQMPHVKSVIGDVTGRDRPKSASTWTRTEGASLDQLLARCRGTLGVPWSRNLRLFRGSLPKWLQPTILRHHRTEVASRGTEVYTFPGCSSHRYSISGPTIESSALEQSGAFRFLAGAIKRLLSLLFLRDAGGAESCRRGLRRRVAAPDHLPDVLADRGFTGTLLKWHGRLLWS